MDAPSLDVDEDPPYPKQSQDTEPFPAYFEPPMPQDPYDSSEFTYSSPIASPWSTSTTPTSTNTTNLTNSAPPKFTIGRSSPQIGEAEQIHYHAPTQATSPRLLIKDPDSPGSNTERRETAFKSALQTFKDFLTVDRAESADGGVNTMPRIKYRRTGTETSSPSEDGDRSRTMSEIGRDADDRQGRLEKWLSEKADEESSDEKERENLIRDEVECYSRRMFVRRLSLPRRPKSRPSSGLDYENDGSDHDQVPEQTILWPQEMIVPNDASTERTLVYSLDEVRWTVAHTVIRHRDKRGYNYKRLLDEIIGLNKWLTSSEQALSKVRNACTDTWRSDSVNHDTSWKENKERPTPENRVDGKEQGKETATDPDSCPVFVLRLRSDYMVAVRSYSRLRMEIRHLKTELQSSPDFNKAQFHARLLDLNPLLDNRALMVIWEECFSTKGEEDTVDFGKGHRNLLNDNTKGGHSAETQGAEKAGELDRDQTTKSTGRRQLSTQDTQNDPGIKQIDPNVQDLLPSKHRVSFSFFPGLHEMSDLQTPEERARSRTACIGKFVLRNGVDGTYGLVPDYRTPINLDDALALNDTYRPGLRAIDPFMYTQHYVQDHNAENDKIYEQQQPAFNENRKDSGGQGLGLQTDGCSNYKDNWGEVNAAWAVDKEAGSDDKAAHESEAATGSAATDPASTQCRRVKASHRRQQSNCEPSSSDPSASEPRTPTPASKGSRQRSSSGTRAQDMNNSFPRFEDSMMNNNLPRQAPSPGQGLGQANGVGAAAINLMNGIPNAGHQTDMNHLWSVVQQLSEVLAENRQQTAGIVNSVQQLQTRAAQEGTSPTIAQVNGEINASRNAEIINLQSQLTTANRKLASLTNSYDSLNALVTDYENAMQLTMDKLRTYAYEHTQAIIAIHRHYNALLDVERQTNLELRLEHQGWQAGLGRVNELARAALTEHNDATMPYVRKTSALKAENRVLRKLAGWESPEDSEEEDEGEKGQGMEGQMMQQGLQ